MSPTPQRMLASALERLNDAEILRQSHRTESDAPALLSILAFEILLKCAILLSREPVVRTHNYAKLWQALPKAARDEILSEAGARMPGHADLSNIERLLDWYQYIFEKVRYPYEIYEGYTRQEEHELGKLWLSLDAPTEEAVIQYHPMELASLIHGLRSYAERHVP